MESKLFNVYGRPNKVNTQNKHAVMRVKDSVGLLGFIAIQALILNMDFFFLLFIKHKLVKTEIKIKIS